MKQKPSKTRVTQTENLKAMFCKIQKIQALTNNFLKMKCLFCLKKVYDQPITVPL